MIMKIKGKLNLKGLDKLYKKVTQATDNHKTKKDAQPTGEAYA